MKNEDLEFFKALDPERMDGTVQDILINYVNAPSSFCFKKLCLTLKSEKDTLQKENQNLSQILKDNGLYTRQNILGEVE